MKRESESSSATRFVNAVYRQWIVVNFLEQIGLGLFAGSLLAMALLGLAIWQAIPTLPILLLAVGVGLLLGITLAVYRKPNRLAAALEADRQLRLDDLLTSAVFASDHGDCDFRAVVQHMADLRCAAHSPSEVLFRRLGVRSWSGIALAMCIAVTLAVIPFQPSRSQAMDANVSVLSASPLELAAASRSDRGMVPVFNDPRSDDGSNRSMPNVNPVNDAGKNLPSAESNGKRSAENTAGTGSGSAASHKLAENDLAAGPPAGRTPDHTGTAAGGGGGTEPDQPRAEHDAPASGAGIASKQARTVPDWKGAADSHSENIGRPASDPIPPEDRDLVRDFFAK